MFNLRHLLAIFAQILLSMAGAEYLSAIRYNFNNSRGVSIVSKHILIIEDDKNLVDLLMVVLMDEGYSVAVTATPDGCDEQIQQTPPDLIILDINLNLEGIDGLDLCRRLRKKLSTPIIILSGSSADADKVLALKLGANNYLTKPISPRVLLSFIETTFNPPSQPEEVYSEKEEAIKSVFTTLNFEQFSLNLDQHTLSDKSGKVIPITPSEFSILRAFALHPNRVLSREQLLDLTGGSEIYERTIDRFISRLRKKIEKDHKNPVLLKSVYGSGYIFNADVVKKQSQ